MNGVICNEFGGIGWREDFEIFIWEEKSWGFFILIFVLVCRLWFFYIY